MATAVPDVRVPDHREGAAETTALAKSEPPADVAGKQASAVPASIAEGDDGEPTTRLGVRSHTRGGIARGRAVGVTSENHPEALRGYVWSPSAKALLPVAPSGSTAAPEPVDGIPAVAAPERPGPLPALQAPPSEEPTTPEVLERAAPTSL